MKREETLVRVEEMKSGREEGVKGG